MAKFGTEEYLKEAKNKAKKINVDVEYSKRKNKKLVVLKDDKEVGHIGYKPMSDFIQHKDKDRRKRYKQRFKSTRNKKGTKSYYADKILW